MKDGFIKVAAGTPKIRVADCRYNAEQIFTLMREADKQGVKVLALPELCLTGYTCGDLFLQDTLLRGAEEGLQTILDATKNLDMIAAVGLPVRDKWDNKLYNCAAVIQKGEILGLVPKTYLPNYGEFYEQRWFTPSGGPGGMDHRLQLCGQDVSMNATVFTPVTTMPDLVIGVEICEDLWAPKPPSVALAQAGATMILNLSASNETGGQGGLPPVPGHRPVRPAGVRLCVRRRRRGRVHHRPGVCRPQHDRGKRRAAGGAAVRHRASPSARSTWSGWWPSAAG